MVNYELIRLIKFVSRISTHLCKKFYKQILFNTSKIIFNVTDLEFRGEGTKTRSEEPLPPSLRVWLRPCSHLTSSQVRVRRDQVPAHYRGTQPATSISLQLAVGW
jgi:hypothetical protein